MKPSSGFRSLGRLLFPFLLIVCALLAGLGWLGWRVLQQDRALEGQRVQDRLGTGADLVATTLTSKLSELDDLLGQVDAAPEPQQAVRAASVTGPAADGAVVLMFDRSRVSAFPRSSLLYYPLVPDFPTAPAGSFARGESLEYRARDFARAAAFYRDLADSADRATRAEALVRLARTLRKANRPDEALAAYDELAQLAPTRVDEVPVDLMAGHAKCVMFEETHRSVPLAMEAAALLTGLGEGRWQLAEGAYRFYLGDANRWLGRAPDSEAGSADVVALTESATALWRDWQMGRLDGDRATGRRTDRFRDRPLLVAWRGSAERLVALVGTVRFLEHKWLAALQPTFGRLNVQIALTDIDGHAVYRTPVGSARTRIVRSTAETGLPWTLHVAAADPVADLAQLSARRRFVLGGFCLVAVIIAVAGYVTLRAVARELAVARLQSDFVSAVSHEFRTPLSTVRQVSELLADGRVPGEERRQQYYEDLRHESERLNRLVENLLDFGRMEAGAREYRFEEVDTPAFVHAVAGEFTGELAEPGHRVEVGVEKNLPAIRADREALTRALWNLLDNAVKYSPGAKTVWLEARADRSHVLLGVRDEGLGIPADEQRRIFDKFVRGASAQSAGVKGTGLGLAMVQRIVAAHGGEIRVSSEQGRGSTFTIVLPVAGDRESGINNSRHVVPDP